MLKNNSDWSLHCFDCGREFSEEPITSKCDCGGVLELTLDVGNPKVEDFEGNGVWRYSRVLPIEDGITPVTINEGNTPLIPLDKIATDTGLKLFVKNEGQNPTGSFKDRGMTVAVTRAKSIGARTLICASTGNTSASAAAYGSRGGMKVIVLIPSGKIAGGKLVQAVIHGASVIRVAGDFDAALEIMMSQASTRKDLFVVNSVNPFRIEGQKTGAFEIFEQLGRRVPDYVILPVGNAGNISAYWKGFSELKKWGISNKTPRMIGVQASGAAPLADAFLRGEKTVVRWKNPETVASAIRIGNPVSWKKALKAVIDSKGQFLTVSDQEILQSQRDLASKEGIFVEPASAAPLAALPHLRDVIDKNALVVFVCTGSGLKDQNVVPIDPEKIPIVSDVKELSQFL